MKRRSKRPLSYSMTLKHWYQILLEELLPWRIHPSFKTCRRSKQQCATSKVISCLWFLIEKISLRLLNGYMMIWIFMSVLMRLLWATWSLHVFFDHYLVQNLVEVLHWLLGWKNTWLIILMHIIYLWSRIWDMGSSPMSLEQIWLVTWSLYALGKWWSTYLEV